MDASALPTFPIPPDADLSSEEYRAAFRKMGDYTCPPWKSKEVERRTRGQSTNRTWQLMRKYKLTASNVHKAIRTHHTNTNLSKLAREIIWPDPRIDFIPAVKFGKENEARVLEQYAELCREQGRNISIHLGGLTLCTEDKFGCLGASPDAIGEDHDNGDVCYLIEVKSFYAPHSPVRSVMQLALRRKNFCCDVSTKTGAFTLRPSHAYYYQIMTTLGILKLPYCVLLLSFKDDLRMTRVDFNANVWEHIKVDAKQFYSTHMLPLICSSHN